MFKIGDKVRAKAGLMVNVWYGDLMLCNPNMFEELHDGVRNVCGIVGGGRYRLSGSWFDYSAEMLELITTIDPVTFKSGGKTYEPTGEFRVPSNADDGNDEWFYCPGVGHIMHNSAQEAYGSYGKNRIILREVEKKERLLTKLVAGLTVRCNACDCDGVVGELYCTGIPGGTMWFHEGQSEANNPAFAVAVKMGDETIWGANTEGNITVVEEN